MYWRHNGKMTKPNPKGKLGEEKKSKHARSNRGWKAAGQARVNQMPGVLGTVNADANTKDRKGDGGVEAVVGVVVRLWPLDVVRPGREVGRIDGRLYANTMIACMLLPQGCRAPVI